MKYIFNKYLQYSFSEYFYYSFLLQNLENFDRFTYGVEGVMAAYRIALQNTQLFGPTNFAPTINEFANKAKQFPLDGSRYQVYH